ncbi:MAG TPA: IS701 family transposase [Isosphaeraceae bacterium]|nr:IS701 family transposase [Isosphaeraceae bacterium]
MPGIIEFPKLVQDALAQYDDLFANECQRRHFAEYLTGLIVAQRKTVLGIHDEFAQTTDQSCLNRFLTEAVWDVQALNERRLEQLQNDPATRYSDQGVIPIDNTLIDRDGLLIPDAGWYWDHAEDRYKIAQDYLFINYVCTGGKHYPLEFRLFRKEEVCRAIGEPFRNHTALCRELIDWVCERDIPGGFAMDCYCTSAEVLNHIHGKPDWLGRPRGYVGDLKTNRKLEWKGSILKASELAASIPPEDRKELRIGDQRQWFFTATAHIPEVNHKVRIVVLWRYRHDAEPIKILVTNRITWEVSRIVRVYRHRWTGTETFHRDGKQHVGLGDCQLRDLQGQTRHIYLVMLAYSLLMSQLRQGCAKEWALHRLMTIGEACRAMIRESLRTTLAWAIEQVTDRGLSLERVMAQLRMA